MILVEKKILKEKINYRNMVMLLKKSTYSSVFIYKNISEIKYYHYRMYVKVVKKCISQDSVKLITNNIVEKSRILNAVPSRIDFDIQKNSDFLKVGSSKLIRQVNLKKKNLIIRKFKSSINYMSLGKRKIKFKFKNDVNKVVFRQFLYMRLDIVKIFSKRYKKLKYLLKKKLIKHLWFNFFISILNANKINMKLYVQLCEKTAYLSFNKPYRKAKFDIFNKKFLNS
jgi:hypothetical protein